MVWYSYIVGLGYFCHWHYSNSHLCTLLLSPFRTGLLPVFLSCLLWPMDLFPAGIRGNFWEFGRHWRKYFFSLSYHYLAIVPEGGVNSWALSPPMRNVAWPHPLQAGVCRRVNDCIISIGQHCVAPLPILQLFPLLSSTMFPEPRWSRYLTVT